MSCWIRIILLLTTGLLWRGGEASAVVADEKFWTLSPYQVHIAVAVDDRLGMPAASADEVARYLTDRIDATLNPLWQADVEIVAPEELSAKAGGLVQRDYDQLPESLRQYDKLQTILIEATSTGSQLTCREYDVYARHWGGLERVAARQGSFLKERCFQTLLHVFAPQATIDADKETPSRVRLTFRGADLPRRNDELPFVEPGQIYLPLLRRTSRTGELVGGVVPPVPWTYLTVTESLKEGRDRWSAEIASGVRRPFGVRRRGQVQELAIAVRPAERPTRLLFHARSDPSRRLAGYEIYRRSDADNSTQFLGVTDGQGEYILQEVGQEVETLFLRSEGQLLAKVPVVPGLNETIEVPIADDPIRLRAQAELTVIREQLVDLVAQRAILIARARAALERDEVDAAQSLVNELSNLPSRSVFDQQIASAERSANIDDVEDAQVRTKIEKMFVDTRNLLGRFLDSRPISELQTAVTQAQ